MSYACCLWWCLHMICYIIMWELGLFTIEIYIYWLSCSIHNVHSHITNMHGYPLTEIHGAHHGSQLGPLNPWRFPKVLQWGAIKTQCTGWDMRCLLWVETLTYTLRQSLQWHHVALDHVIMASDCINTLRPRQNGHHSAYDIIKCIFVNEMFEFRLKFHWSLFLRVQFTIFQYWFR